MTSSGKTFMVLVFSAINIFAACTSQTKHKPFTNLPGYNLAEPVTYKLKEELNEISGLAFYPKDSSIFSIIDEGGQLYKILLKDKAEVTKWKFAKGRDYEDIIKIDSTFYVLESNGSIFSFRFLSADSLQKQAFKAPFAGKNEFESIYYDEAKSRLVLLCKDCEADSKKRLSAYSFDPATKQYDSAALYRLNVEKMAQRLGLDKMKFKPSATAVHPISGDLYIISSINKAIIVVDKNNKVKEAYPIDPELFKQPEGLTFTPWGDLIISNESANAGHANILVFKYNRDSDAKN